MKSAIILVFALAAIVWPGSGLRATASPVSVESAKPVDLAGQDAEADLEGIIADATLSRDDASERFFKAMQMAEESASTRALLGKLHRHVGAGTADADAMRRRDMIVRRLATLRYRIAALPDDDEAAKVLERQMRAAQDDLRAAEATLTKYSGQPDAAKPATHVVDIQAALLEGEVYWKILAAGSHAYGILITRSSGTFYRMNGSAADIARLSNQVRGSMVGHDGYIEAFDVAGARGLFAMLAGPVAKALGAADRIVVDPWDALGNFPFGALVTDDGSAMRYAATHDANMLDLTKVLFLARTAAISTALSPASFLAARRAPPSRGSQAFIGFAEHVHTLLDQAREPVAAGPHCGVGEDVAAAAVLSNSLSPIGRGEFMAAEAGLRIAATIVTGPDFTDTAIKARADLDQFQIVDFATHGLQQGDYHCVDSPALVTTLGPKDSDGLLSFDEIAKLRLDANLIVLAACNTSGGVDERLARTTGQETIGRNLTGLVRAFLVANARTVMATYWPLSEESAHRFLRHFYDGGRTSDMGRAFHAAQLDLLDDRNYSHPFYWGTLFLVGDASKPMLTPSIP